MSDHDPHNFRLQRDGSAENWYCAYSLGRRTPRRSMGTTDKKLAEKRMQTFIATFTAPKVNGTPESLLVNHLLHLYDASKGPKVKSLKAHKHALGILLEFYEGRYVSDIPPTNDEFEAAMRERGLSEGTINRVRSPLRSALKTAQKSLKLTAAPFVPTLKEPPASDDYLAMKRLLRLLRQMRGNWRYHLRLFTHIAYFTAARHEAVLGLRWDQVDFDDRLIDFRRRDSKGKLEVETNKRRPNTKMNRKLVRVLRYAKAREERLAKAEGRQPVQHVVHYQGKPLLRVDGAFKTACLRAGLPPYTPHILKHTRITLLLGKGVDPWDVVKLTATSLKTIEKVYGKHIKNRLEDAVNAV
jgi:integrase